MSMRFTYTTGPGGANKMRRFPTKVVNIIGGPGTQKSFYTALLTLLAHRHQMSVETIPDHAKFLVWQQDMEALKNQYQIAHQQYQMLSLLDGQVHFLINECSFPQLLYYNQYYPENICDVNKTKRQMLQWYGEFENINLLVLRDPNVPYHNTGRLQDEEKAHEADKHLRATLLYENIRSTPVLPNEEAILEFGRTHLLGVTKN